MPPDGIHRPLGGHALVIGAGMAGLAAAGALRSRFERVTVCEKDPLSGPSGPRKGVPQAIHQHALLKRGEVLFDALIPGSMEAVRAAGGVSIDWGADYRHFDGEDWYPRRALGLSVLSQTRPLLEETVREVLAGVPNVRIRDGTRVQAVALAGEDAPVAVELRRSDGTVGRVDADLVVDCAGRGSPTTRWLAAAGYEPPELETLPIDVTYVTALFEVPPARRGTREMLRVEPVLPSTRAAGLAPVEGGRWLVTLVGRGDDAPPRDEAGFLAFADSLGVPDVHRTIAAARWATPTHRYRIKESTWWHFEALERFPERFLPLGDTISTFNPTRGQGMSVAAMHAQALADILDERRRSGGGLEALWRAYLPAAAKQSAMAWKVAKNADIPFLHPDGPAAPEVRERVAYTFAMRRVMEADPGAHRAVSDVVHMLADGRRLAELGLAERAAALVRGEASAPVRPPSSA